MYEFLFADDFLKSLKQLDGAQQKAIKEKLNFLSQQENPLLYAKKLKGLNGILRFRVGSYRIIFKVEKNQIILLIIGHRSEIYKRLK